MKFSNLNIRDWKQFQEINIHFHDKLTILTGANGSGKTTLLHLLARHFGWDFCELATPAREEESGIVKFFTNLFFKKNNNLLNEIGSIEYSSNKISKIQLPNTNSAKYQVTIQNPEQVKGLNIEAHRELFKYSEVPNILTKKISRAQAYNSVFENYKRHTFQTGYYEHKSHNILIKETLLSWAIAGGGNKFMQPDQELENNFIDFQNILKIILPDSIGFKKLVIRNFEIVLVTSSGEFMLDAVSGGIAALIDLAWQIFTFSNLNEDIVILIDEVENHLHATMQRSVLPNITNAFPNAQFIVSTHSPLVVGSVKDSNVYAFRYNENSKVISERLDLVHKARTATEILNEVLGVPFTMPIWAEKTLIDLINKYRTIQITEDNINLMREEFSSVGLESLMPLAIKGVFEK